MKCTPRLPKADTNGAPDRLIRRYISIGGIPKWRPLRHSQAHDNLQLGDKGCTATERNLTSQDLEQVRTFWPRVQGDIPLGGGKGDAEANPARWIPVIRYGYLIFHFVLRYKWGACN